MRPLETAVALLGLLLALSCSSKSSRSSPQCRLDSDCAVGSICQANKCTPGCKASRDCPTGESCIAGQCSTGGSGGADGGPDASAGGASGSGGTAGGTPGSELGAQCSSDSDCGSGLHCALATGNDFGFEGPSRGYCTLPCSSDSQCSVLFPGSTCEDLGFGDWFCMRGCDPSSGSVQCLNRYDEACVPWYAPDGGMTGHVCAPACVTDNDCSGRKCDPYTELCTDAPKTGDPVGTPCDPTASTNSCAGICIGFSSTDPTVGLCTSICNYASVGVEGACGSDPQQGSPQTAACVNEVTYPDGTKAGLCDQLCNCDSDCDGADMVCESWAQSGAPNPGQLASLFQKQGYCEFRFLVPGIPGLPTCSQDGGAQDGGIQDGGVDAE